MNKAFDKILERLDNHIEDAKSEGDFSYIKPFEIAKRAVQEVAEEYNDGWIPCSERLPDVLENVLLTLRSLDVFIGFRGKTDGYFYVIGTDSKYIAYENVIAWQPLPEAYKERD